MSGGGAHHRALVPGGGEPRAPIADDPTFTLVTDLVIRQAIRRPSYVSMLGIAADVSSDRRLDPAAVLRAVAETVSGAVRGSDVVCLRSVWPYLRVLLVGAYLYDLPTIIARITRLLNGPGSSPPAFSVALSFGGACFPTTARGREELFSQAGSLLSEAQQAQTPGHRYRLAAAAR